MFHYCLLFLTVVENSHEFPDNFKIQLLKSLIYLQFRGLICSWQSDRAGTSKFIINILMAPRERSFINLKKEHSKGIDRQTVTWDKSHQAVPWCVHEWISSWEADKQPWQRYENIGSNFSSHTEKQWPTRPKLLKRVCRTSASYMKYVGNEGVITAYFPQLL